MGKKTVIFEDLGTMDYQTAWDYQEKLLQQNVKLKSIRILESGVQESGVGRGKI